MSQTNPTTDDLFADGKKSTKKMMIDVSPNVKIATVLFILFMTITSDIFVNNVLVLGGQSTTNGRQPTVYGAVVQGVLLVLGYIICFYLVKNDIL
jgi:general stress protein CsbA